MKDLNQEESLEIKGGSFAMDLGWFIGHILNGNFGSSAGLANAILDYQILYSKK
jgi:hypothetical protein